MISILSYCEELMNIALRAHLIPLRTAIARKETRNPDGDVGKGAPHSLFMRVETEIAMCPFIWEIGGFRRTKDTRRTKCKKSVFLVLRPMKWP